MDLIKNFVLRMRERKTPAPKQIGEDAFHLRLTRLHLRETRRSVRGSVFLRNQA